MKSLFKKFVTEVSEKSLRQKPGVWDFSVVVGKGCVPDGSRSDWVVGSKGTGTWDPEGLESPRGRVDETS